MTDKTQPTAHAEITAPISADLRGIDGAHAQPDALRKPDRECLDAFMKAAKDAGVTHMQKWADVSGYQCADCKTPLKQGYDCGACGSFEAEEVDRSALQAAPPAPAAATLPEGWTACRIEHEPGYPEDVAFGPQIMMDRLKKWLDRHFAALAAAPAQAWPSECDSPELCRVHRGCAGQYGTKNTCPSFAVLNPCNPAATAQEHATKDGAVEWAGYKPLLASAIAAKDAMLARGIRYDRFDPMFAAFLAKVDADQQEHATQLAGQGGTADPSRECLLQIAEPDSREAQMVVIKRGADGVPTVWCDPEIADVVRALNDGGIPTIASCSGHGEKYGGIALSDGRQLMVIPSLEEFIAAHAALQAAPPALAHDCCDSWFMSLSEGRQAALRDDKWMLAHAAFDAGRAALATAPAQEQAREYWAVLSKSGQGVIFDDEDDARWTSTGEGQGSGGFGVPTIGDNFRNCYDDEAEEGTLELVRVQVLAARAAQGGAA